MHISRITSILGVAIASVGLLMKSAVTDGEEILPGLNAANPAFPAGIDDGFTALWNEDAVVTTIFVVALLVVLILSFMPNIKDALSKTSAMLVTVLGVVVAVLAVFFTLGAMDNADTLQAGFAEAAAGAMIPVAFTVSIGIGWYLMIIAGLIVALAGYKQLRTK